MDFRLTDEQRLIRKAARDFAEKELAPKAREWEETHTFSREVFDMMGQLDFTGLYVPEEFDGTGVGRLTAALIFEELAKGCFATAVKTEGGYVVNGTKLYVTSGGVADIDAVMVRTDAALKKKGISAMITERGTPGFTFGPFEPKMGLNASPTTELNFDDCFIPAEDLLGEEGRGLNMALTALNGGRVSIGA